METVKINLVSNKLILDFHKIVNPIFEKILNLQLQNQNLKKTRDLLIPRLVSGKLDVEKLEVR
jgi:type I restriction enzyme S subunit